MSIRNKSLCLILALLGGLLAAPALAAPSASEAYDAGKKQLAEGQFDAALTSFEQAVRADRANREYATEYMVLRQIVQLRAMLDQEKDAARWDRIARTLHVYYSQQRLYKPLLDIDAKLFAASPSASTATMLAETQLACRDAKGAVETLQSLDAKAATPSTQALLGLAHAKNGDLEEAKRVAEAITLTAAEGPGPAYRVARLHGAVGDQDAAVEHLTKCFESVAPSQLPAFKAHAQGAQEFASFADSPAFAVAMKTESKVSESACSGGSKCASCPSRGSCPSSAN